jgi:hypothetical protein
MVWRSPARLRPGPGLQLIRHLLSTAEDIEHDKRGIELVEVCDSKPIVGSEAPLFDFNADRTRKRMSIRRFTTDVDGTIPVPALLYDDEELLASQDNVGIYDEYVSS